MGHRQLISFARAVIGDPRVIVLDEATANIDTHTEVLIQQALKRVLQGRTSIVIAHRLSTIRNADNIVVLDQGRLVEMGDHEELLAQGGVYARLHAVNYGLSTATGGDESNDTPGIDRTGQTPGLAGQDGPDPEPLSGLSPLPAPADDD